MMTTPRRLCRQIVLNKDTGEIHLDSIAFPFYVRPDVTIDDVNADGMASLKVSILASNILVIDRGRTIRPDAVQQRHADVRTPIFEAVVADRGSMSRAEGA